MTAGQIVLAAVAVLLVAVLLLRVGVRVEYNPDGFWLYLRIGAVYRKIVPAARTKAAGKKTGTNKPKKAAPKKRKTDQLALIRALVLPALRAVRRLFGKLQVDKLELVLKAGAQDPGDAALQYGRANAVLGSLWQPMVNGLNVIDGHARVEIDFEQTRPRIFLFTSLSLRVGQLLWIALIFVFQAVDMLLRNSNNMTPNG